MKKSLKIIFLSFVTYSSENKSIQETHSLKNFSKSLTMNYESLENDLKNTLFKLKLSIIKKFLNFIDRDGCYGPKQT